MEMNDSHAEDGAAVEGEDGGFSPSVLPAVGRGAAENAGSSVHQIDPSESHNESASNFDYEEHYNGNLVEDGGRDDMFVDCPDEIETSSQQNDEDNLRAFQDDDSKSEVKSQLIYGLEQLTNGNGLVDKERNIAQYEEEKRVTMAELANLYHQVKAYHDQQAKHYEHDEHTELPPNSSLGSDLSSTEMLRECSRFFKNASVERLENEERVKELHFLLHTKDQEMESLFAKLADMSHIEASVNNMLASLSMLYQQEILEGNLSEKIVNVEKSIPFLVENFLTFSAETEQLRRCLVEVGANSSMVHESETFSIARELILESRRKEGILLTDISTLQDDRSKIIHELDEHRSLVDNLKSEIQRLTAEVEHEKSKCVNTKEKLSLAVTKGKALVQQRDSLKQFLAEKTDELEKCSHELHEKSTALQAAEKAKELLEDTEKFASSLQASLSEKEFILQKCKEILSEGMASDELQSGDISDPIQMLVNENIFLKSEYHKLDNAISSVNFPESVSSRELDYRINWLVEVLHYSKQEAVRLNSMVANTNESAHFEISNLTVLFVVQSLEIYCLEAEGKELREQYEHGERLRCEITEERESLNMDIDQLKALRAVDSQEKSSLLEELGKLRQEYNVAIEKEISHHDEEVNELKALLSTKTLELTCLQSEYENLSQRYEGVIERERLISADKDKDKLCQYDEAFEIFQGLIYMAYHEMSLYQLIFEEDALDREIVDNLSDELEKMKLKLNALVDEKAAMQENLGHLEDRCAVLKEKLSMAVKKGKGLAMEKETHKNILNDKNSEIENLKSKLEQNMSQYNACLDQITKLTREVDLIPTLQKELVYAREQVDQTEKYFSESESTLKTVMESVQSITLPNNLVFEEPVEKLRWISMYLNDSEIAKMEAEEELKKVKHESSMLSGKLSSMQAIIKSLEDALLVAENNQSVLLNEKEELVVSKAVLEKELIEEKEKAASHLSNLEKVSLSTRSIEDDLSQAKVNISQLIHDRDVAVENKNRAEEKLEKLEEESSHQISELSDARKTIESLENALSKAQENIAVLAEENNEIELGREDLSREIQKLRIEAELNFSKISESSNTIRLLEASLADAENKVEELIQLKKFNEEEISALSSKLELCTEELDRAHGSMGNNSMDLALIRNQFQMLLKDETLPLLMAQYSERHIESLKNIDSLVKDIRGCFTEIEPDLENGFASEEHSPISTGYSTSSVVFWNSEGSEDELDGVENTLSYIEMVNGRVFKKNKVLADRFGNFSAYVNESYQSLLRQLHGTRDIIRSTVNYTKVLKENMKDMDSDRQRCEETIASLNSDNMILSNACADATDRLDSNFRNSVTELKSISKLIDIELDLPMVAQKAPTRLSTNNVETAEELSKAITDNCDLIQLVNDALQKLSALNGDLNKRLEETQLALREVSEESELYKNQILKLAEDLDAQHKMSEGNQDLQKRLEETQLALGEVSKESSLYKNQILKLEEDLESQQSLYTVQISEFKEEMDELKKRESELSTSLSKFQEMHSPLLPAPELNSILGKLNGVIVPIEYINSSGHTYTSTDVRKLCYILDSFNGSFHKLNALSSENKELKFTLDNQITEIESLRKQVQEQEENRLDAEEANKLVEIESGLKRLVKKLGGSDQWDDKKIYEPVQLVSMVDQLVMAITLKYELSRSKNNELGSTLLTTPKDLDVLSNKVNSHENADTLSASQTEIEHVNEGLVPPPPHSEISESQGMGTLNKVNAISPVPSAAHSRTLRKGSSDHLAINIDSERQQLILNNDTDSDKGHVFKSLNTSGMIPRQGRVVADRIDGIWVSGSRALMNHPRGRLGLIAYMLVVHLWLVGTIL